MFQESFSEEEVLQGCFMIFKGVPSVFQMGFKEVSRKFSMYFKKVSSCMALIAASRAKEQRKPNNSAEFLSMAEIRLPLKGSRSPF